MLEAKDVMTKKVICIGKDTPIVEAIRLMANKNPLGARRPETVPHVR
ncbi:MAG: CBS domain-containing protein [Planctomycetota bacterium]|jgi:predicted transcriptional regulator